MTAISYTTAINTLPTKVGQLLRRVLVIGDLHISDKFSSKHVDYFQDCIDFLAEITAIIKEKGITHVIHTGDLIGRTTEKNLKSRDSLTYMMSVLKYWNELTDGNVYSVRGNHDYSATTTDFEMFETLGFLKTADHIDIGAMRLHLINYGEHKRKIDFREDVYNAAVMHTNLQVEGVTTWFEGGHDGVELSSLENLYGVELVIAGHIHNPSERTVTTSIRDKSISLFYPGNGTRPRKERNLWDYCYAVLFDTDDEDVAIGQIEFKLRPKDEIFIEAEVDILDEDENEEEQLQVGKFNREDLADIMSQLKDYNLMGDADYKTQLKKLGGIDKDAVDLALSYIEAVEGEFD